MNQSNPLQSLLQCPKHHCQLDFSGDRIKCGHGEIILKDEDVLLLEPDYELDPIYQWGPALRDPQANLKLDHTKSLMAKKDSKQRLTNMIGFIANNLNLRVPLVLDLVTGRGLLIRQILPTFKHTHLFLNDISANVLVGTTKLLQPFPNKNTVTPLQSTATNLPFQDNSLDLIVSFGPNNIKESELALAQCYRVLKPGGQFIFSMSLFEIDSPSHHWLKANQPPVSPFSFINNWREPIDKVGFVLTKQVVLFDGPVNKIPLDLLPRVNGERFQDIGVILNKN